MRSLQARIKDLEVRLESRHNAEVQSPVPISKDLSTYLSFEYDVKAQESNMQPIATSILGRLHVRANGQLHYFGPQSNYHLTDSGLGPNAMGSPTDLQQQGLYAVNKLKKGVPISITLQEHLLELYWTWQHPLTYVIHKKVFQDAFASRTYGSYCTPLLLSSIFALTTQFSDHAELQNSVNEHQTITHSLFEQAKILFLYESQAPTVATVQATVLMSLRALSDGNEALGWLYCGNYIGRFIYSAKTYLSQGTRFVWHSTWDSTSTVHSP